MTKEKWLDDFSYNLSEMMDFTNTSQRELAKMTGLSPATINGYLKGTIMPSAIAVINIAIVLECNIDELINMNEFIE